MQSQVTMDPHVGPGLGDSEVSRQKADCCNDPCNCLLAKDAAFERRMRRGCQRGVLLWAEIFSEAFLQRGRSHLQDHSPFALFLVHPIAFWVWFCSRLVFRCCLFGVYYASGIVLSSIHTHLVKTLLRNWRWRSGGKDAQGHWLVSLALQPRLFHHARVSFTDEVCLPETLTPGLMMASLNLSLLRYHKGMMPPTYQAVMSINRDNCTRRKRKKEIFLVFFTKPLCSKLKDNAEKEENRTTSRTRIDAKLLKKIVAEWEMWYFLCN